MITVEFKHGFLRRKVKFTFDLAALRRATAACKLDLGEFYSSEKVSDEQRIFYHSYGAWLNRRDHSRDLLKRYYKLYTKFTVEQINKIKVGIQSANIVSSELNNLMKATAQAKAEKKNR